METGVELGEDFDFSINFISYRSSNGEDVNE